MASRFMERANKRIGLGNVAILLVSASFIGQILGFLRTKLVNANFSALGAHSTDAYFAAFNIPDLFFYTISAGALTVAFIPVLTDHLSRGDKKGANELTTSLLNLMVVVMGVVGVLIFIFAKPLIHYIVAPAMDPAQLQTTADIMKLLAFNPLLFTISGVLTSVQQSIGRFFFYAIAPIFYNACIIASIYIFKNNIGIVGLGLGALIGAVLQLIIVSFGLLGRSIDWKPKIMWRSSDFKTVLKNLPPRSVDQGMDQIESIIETRFARGLGVGNVSYYNNAFILQSAPVLLIGSAISTAVFPKLSHRIVQHRPDLFRKDFLQILRVMIWIIAPIAIVSYFARGYLARLIFSRDSSEISIIFGYLTAAIFFRTIYAIVSRWYYAQKDTVTPLLISIFTISLNVVLAYSLSRPWNYGVAGLAIAQSMVAAIEVFILFVIMLFRDRKLFDWNFWGGVMKIISVSGFSVLAAYIMVSIFPLGLNDRGIITLGAKLGVISLVTLCVHLGISALFGLEEPKPILRRIQRIILRPVKVVY